MSNDEQIPVWWGPHDIEIGQVAGWHIGPLRLWVQRTPSDWLVAHQYDDAAGDHISVEIPAEDDDLMDNANVTRFGLTTVSPRVTLTPILADRPVITKPRYPFVVPAGQEVVVYMSSAVWVRIAVGDPPMALIELPSFPLQETWFGADTISGEFGYASRTSMRLSLADLPRRPNRVTSEISIQNHGEDALTIDRLNLPVNYLTLYRVPNGMLWTESVVFERPPENAPVELRLRESVGKGIPAGASAVTPPRTAMADGLVRRALATLFS